MTTPKKCVFCDIVNGEDKQTDIILTKALLEKKKRDIRPATPHHYLVVTRQHITDAKQLKNEDVTLVEQMVATGQEVLRIQGADDTDVRMGFHWPPFHTISHLHLHVISATTQMGWIARGIFKENSFWFVSSAWLHDRLKKMEKIKYETETQS